MLDPQAIAQYIAQNGTVIYQAGASGALGDINRLNSLGNSINNGTFSINGDSYSYLTPNEGNVAARSYYITENLNDGSTSGNRNSANAGGSNPPPNIGLGFMFSVGLAISDWGRTISIGFFGAPHTVGQLFLSIGKPTGLEAGLSMQALAGVTKQKYWDISGSGEGGGFGYGDVAGSYSTTSNNAYNIVGFGPALSIKPSYPMGGSVAPTTTYTLPMLWPKLFNAVGFKF